MANPSSLAVGPGAIEESGVGPRPMLEGSSEYEYVEILNPLSVTFIGKFGVTKPVMSPFEIHQSPNTSTVSRTEEDVRRNYGLDLRNPNHQARVQISNTVEIKAGQTVRLLGNEAQVVVRQLVNEIMNREKKQLLLADAHARHEVEERIIMGRGTTEDLLGSRPITIQEQLQSAIKEPKDEAFPDRPVETEVPASERAPEQPTDGDTSSSRKAKTAKS